MYAFVFLSILKDKHIHNRLILAYRTEASFNVLLASTPSTKFIKFCAFKILFFATISFGAFFLAFALNEFFACD